MLYIYCTKDVENSPGGRGGKVRGGATSKEEEQSK
jgi:hypothetical protein